MRYLHLQHHNGDYDCDHAIAERFQPALGQVPSALAISSRAPEWSQPSTSTFYLLYRSPAVAAFYPVWHSDIGWHHVRVGKWTRIAASTRIRDVPTHSSFGRMPWCLSSSPETTPTTLRIKVFSSNSSATAAVTDL